MLTNILQNIPTSAWLWLGAAVVISAVLRSPRFKGWIGELLVRLVARLRLDREVYHELYNVMLRTPDGTTQIDHVFVSRFGVFVVETKNMRGWIFGSVKERMWTQKIYRRSFRFQNPLRQNFKHVMALKAALDVPPEAIHPVVTFVGAGAFKTPMPANVTRGAGFVHYIKSFRDPVLSPEQVEGALEALGRKRLRRGSQLARTHVKRLRERVHPDAHRLCPKCGSALALRTVKRGARAGQRFWGCSNYPKCRFTQDLR